MFIMGVHQSLWKKYEKWIPQCKGIESEFLPRHSHPGHPSSEIYSQTPKNHVPCYAMLWGCLFHEFLDVLGVAMGHCSRHIGNHKIGHMLYRWNHPILVILCQLLDEHIQFWGSQSCPYPQIHRFKQKLNCQAQDAVAVGAFWSRHSLKESVQSPAGATHVPSALADTNPTVSLHSNHPQPSLHCPYRKKPGFLGTARGWNIFGIPCISGCFG